MEGVREGDFHLDRHVRGWSAAGGLPPTLRAVPKPSERDKGRDKRKWGEDMEKRSWRNGKKRNNNVDSFKYRN